jgi:hypothetical protein
MPRGAQPARYPPSGGAWPLELRADLAAAFLDYPDTRSFFAAVMRGEAPRPTGLRSKGKGREPIWARPVMERFVAQRHDLDQDAAVAQDDIAGLI